MQKSLGEATSWADRRKLTQAIFTYIKGNLFPKNDYKWGERKQGEEAIYAEPEMTLGELDSPNIRHGIHWSRELRDIIEGPKTSENINQWSKNDVLRRFNNGTKRNPYVPTSDFYGAGVKKEGVVSPKIPHAVKFMADDIYPLNSDPLKIFEKVKRIKSDDAWADEGNILARLLKEEGYSGLVAEHTKGSPIIRTWERQAAHGPVRVTTDHSTVIESLGNFSDDLQKLSVRGNSQFVDEMAKIENLARTRYDSIKIDYGNVSLAKFGDATSGQMENGFTLSMEGPIPSIRSILSEVGRGNTQHSVIMRYNATEEIANGITYRFKLKEGLNAEKLNTRLKSLDVPEYKFIEHKDGSVSVDQFIMPDDSIEGVLKLHREIGQGDIEKVLQKSEVLGDYNWTGNIDIAKKNYEKTIGDYFGKEKAAEILKETPGRK